MRIREPKTTALIFASGKMVVTGAKSEDDSKLASRKYARIIQKLGFNAKFTDFKIQNIVGSCDIKFPIRLEGLASKHHNFSSYEPELFPGLIYRMIKPKIVLLIFVSGKIVLTGAKVREEIYQAFEMIYPVLQGLLALARSFLCVTCLVTTSQTSGRCKTLLRSYRGNEPRHPPPDEVLFPTCILPHSRYHDYPQQHHQPHQPLPPKNCYGMKLGLEVGHLPSIVPCLLLFFSLFSTALQRRSGRKLQEPVKISGLEALEDRLVLRTSE